MRLNVYLAHSGLCSRRRADEYIFSGRICINGRVVKEPWFQLNGTEKVTFDNRTVGQGQKKVYIMVNKPEGYVCTLSDKFAPHKVIDLVPPKFGRLYPAGRLDKDSRGLVLLTNDGDFTYHLLHPKFRIEKEYMVKVSPKFWRSHCREMLKGVREEEDVLKVKFIEVLEDFKDSSELRIILTEGKKRQIRRMCKLLGYNVLSLERVRIGKLQMGNLKEGKYKVIPKVQAQKVFGR